MMALAFLVNAGASNLTALQLDPSVTVFIGLILGEISKALNNYLSNK